MNPKFSAIIDLTSTCLHAWIGWFTNRDRSFFWAPLDWNQAKGINLVLVDVGRGEGAKDGGGVIVGMAAVKEVVPTSTREEGGIRDDGEAAWATCGSVIVVKSEWYEVLQVSKKGWPVMVLRTLDVKGVDLRGEIGVWPPFVLGAIV